MVWSNQNRNYKNNVSKQIVGNFRKNQHDPKGQSRPTLASEAPPLRVDSKHVDGDCLKRASLEAMKFSIILGFPQWFIPAN